MVSRIAQYETTALSCTVLISSLMNTWSHGSLRSTLSPPSLQTQLLTTSSSLTSSPILSILLVSASLIDAETTSPRWNNASRTTWSLNSRTLAQLLESKVRISVLQIKLTLLYSELSCRLSNVTYSTSSRNWHLDKSRRSKPLWARINDEASSSESTLLGHPTCTTSSSRLRKLWTEWSTSTCSPQMCSEWTSPRTSRPAHTTLGTSWVRALPSTACLDRLNLQFQTIKALENWSWWKATELFIWTSQKENQL